MYTLSEDSGQLWSSQPGLIFTWHLKSTYVAEYPNFLQVSVPFSWFCHVMVHFLQYGCWRYNCPCRYKKVSLHPAFLHIMYEITHLFHSIHTCTTMPYTAALLLARTVLKVQVRTGNGRPRECNIQFKVNIFAYVLKKKILCQRNCLC